MNPENWKKIEDIFQDALDLPAAERERFIAEKCAGDAELRSEVEKLIARYETEEEFLESPVWTDSGILQATLKNKIAASLDEEITPRGAKESFIGRQIKVYRLIEELGRGGMGIVYLGERNDGEFRQQVAVKLIKRGMDSDFIVKKFRHERQILANFNHPYIARLLDGGTTEDGLPYFVMEYIEGKPFFKYIEAEKLDLRSRLNLFLSVCNAVAYAHDKKIIHRDIKPGNIIVGADGSPRLLDFGIAKILDPDAVHESVAQTATQMRLMTPEYASPEQARGDEITPASDQYSLGVLLFEMVTGARPYKFSSRAPHEIARVICEQEPSTPSSTGYLKASDETIFTPNQKVVLQSNGDFGDKLDRVILKTLRKNPAQRYASVKDLSADLGRLLANLPVRAEQFETGESFSRKSDALAETKSDQKSIAVLPLQILNAVKSEETNSGQFLSVGLADALITRLSNVRQFIVRPTSSVLRYSEGDFDTFKAGRDLNVEFVLSGNILRANNRIRISVQLLNVANQSIFWAERFDEDFTDVLTLEDKVSAKVADLLVPQLTTGERKKLAKRGTENAEAYEAYLRGRFYKNIFSEDAFAKAFVAYHEAISHDADYALAYAGIADYYIWLGVYGGMPPKECYPLAKQAALRAIELDDALAEAYASLAFAQICGDYDWIEAERNAVRAVELNSNYSTARLWYSYILLTAERFDESIAQAKRAVELDPSTYFSHHVLALNYYFARRFDEAQAQAAANVKNFPHISATFFTQGWTLRYLGKHEEALNSSKRAMELSGESLYDLLGYAQSLAAAGRRAETETALRRIFAQGEKQYLSYYQIAVIYVYLDETEKALDALERAFGDHEGWLIWLRTEPALDKLRGNARFKNLRKKVDRRAINLPDETDSQAEAAAPQSIAVLPFKTTGDASSEEADSGEFLGVGLADALITRLSNAKQFIVRPTSSVLRFGAEAFDSFAAGDALNVKFVLDGEAARGDETFRVSVRLLDVEHKSVVWAERFEENFTDFLALEDSISEKVAGSLVPRLTTRERRNLTKRGTENAEAYEAFLRGRFHWNTFTEESFKQAIFFYQKAVALDPNYAVAYAGIADYFMWLGIFGVLPPKDSYQKAKATAQKAVALDPTLAEAFAALGFAELCGDYDWTTSEKNIRRALEINPNYAVAHNWLAISLYTAGRFDEGIEHAKKSIELDPLTYQNYRTLSWGFYFSRRFEESLAVINRTIEKFPMTGTAYANRSWLLRSTNRPEEAFRDSEKALQTAGKSIFVLTGHAQALASAGKLVEAEQLIEAIKTNPAAKYVSQYQIALVYCYAKQPEKALAALERAWTDRDGWLVWLGIEPALDILRDDARFQSLIERVKHPLAHSHRVAATAEQNHETLSEAETIVQSEDADRLKEKTEQKQSEETITAESKKVEETRQSVSSKKPLKYALIAAALIVLAFGAYHIFSHSTFDFSSNKSASGENLRDSFASKMNAARLTDSGREQVTAVSPDGKLIASVFRDDDKQGIWVRDTDGKNPRQIVAPESVLIAGLSFAPDNQTIYYSGWSQNFIQRNLYRVSVAGENAPQLVLEQVLSKVGFSADGKRFAYNSFDQKTRQNFLKIADLDANGAVTTTRTLATYSQPDFIRSNASFAPDGEKVCYIVSQSVEKKGVMSLHVFDLETNSETKIGAQTFGDVSGVDWNSAGELIVSAAERDGAPYQLWSIAYPTGEAARLTNDLNSYFDVSISNNSTVLATAKREKYSAVWLVDLDSPNDTGKQLTVGNDRLDGLNGVDWTSDNQILYVGGIGTQYFLTEINADGSNSRVLDVNVVKPAFPKIAKDKRYVVYADAKEEGSSVWRYDTASGSLAQLAPNYAVAPSLSADNRFVIYSANNSSRKLSLHKIPIEGGSETEIVSALSARAAASPDGKWLACYYSGEETGNSWRITILSVETGAVRRVITPPDTFQQLTPIERPLGWSPDSRSLYYVNDKNNVSNIFRIAVETETPPEQITHFTTGRIFDFSLSPDGRRAALGRGSSTSDVLVYKNS